MVAILYCFVLLLPFSLYDLHRKIEYVDLGFLIKQSSEYQCVLIVSPFSNFFVPVSNSLAYPFVFNLLTALLLYLVLYILSDPIARFYGVPIVADTIKVVGVTIKVILFLNRSIR